MYVQLERTREETVVTHL